MTYYNKNKNFIINSEKVKTIIKQSKLNTDEQLKLIKILDSHPELLYYPPRTVIHELLHIYLGHMFYEKNCGFCYVYNIICDYKVEKFINDNFTNINSFINRLSDTVLSLGVTDFNDYLYWDCDSCQFKCKNAINVNEDELPSVSTECTIIRYKLEMMINQIIKTFIPTTHRHYMYLYKNHNVTIPHNAITTKKIAIFIDASTSIPNSIVKTALHTSFKFKHIKNDIHIYTFSDIVLKSNSPYEVRRTNETHIKPVLELCDKYDYSIIITDNVFDDYNLSDYKNDKIFNINVHNTL